MNRTEHLQWCKDRAIEYIDKGDVINGIASFMSDMTKHDETANHIALPLIFQLHRRGKLSTPEETKKFILDFN